MKKKPKGYLIMLIVFLLTGTGIYIGTEYDCLFLKNASMMLSAFAGGYVGSVYIHPPKEKPISQSHWKWYFLVVLILAALFTWIEKNAL